MTVALAIIKLVKVYGFMYSSLLSTQSTTVKPGQEADITAHGFLSKCKNIQFCQRTNQNLRKNDKDIKLGLYTYIISLNASQLHNYV